MSRERELIPVLDEYIVTKGKLIPVYYYEYIVIWDC